MAAEEYIRYPGRRPLEPEASFNPWIIRIPILMVLGVALLALALAALLAGVQITYAERIAPGTTSLGVDLGGMTHAEAVAALDGQFAYPQATVFTFRDGERVVGMTVRYPPPGQYFFVTPVGARSNNVRMLVNGDALTSIEPLPALAPEGLRLRHG